MAASLDTALSLGSAFIRREIPLLRSLLSSRPGGCIEIRAIIGLMDPFRIATNSWSPGDTRAVAHAARTEGARAIVCLSSLVPQNKRDAIRELGAEVRIIGTSQDDAQLEVDRLEREEGLSVIPPFDHPAVIAGQGTIGLEILEDLKDVDLVLVQVSGGGLISGIAAAIKLKNKKVKIYGVEPEIAADARDSLHQKKIVKWSAM